jgi:large subunit ribosomal protein L25
MKIEKRTESLRFVRDEKKIPGVMFGKTIEPETIQMEEKDFRDTFKQYGLTQTFDVKLGRKKHQVYFKDIQRHVVNPNVVLNVKLQKVEAGDTIKASLPIVLLGKEGIEKPGVLVQLITDSVEVEFGVGQGIQNIELDVSGLGIGDSLAIADLNLPQGIELVDDPKKIVVNVSETKYVEEDLETEEVTDPMDVEVITEKTED